MVGVAEGVVGDVGGSASSRNWLGGVVKCRWWPK